jgi:bifunctional non-homologous end joining protein LigD
VIDGEAVVLGPNGISDFDALHAGKRNADVRLYAFDLLADDGVDMRDETLRIRKLWLDKLLKRSRDGILYNEDEAGAIGPRLFEQACKMGLGGSCRSTRGYKAGPVKHWIKIKNPKSPAMIGAKDVDWVTPGRLPHS